MDRAALTQKLTKAFDKYKFFLLVLAVGVFLMSFPTGSEEEIPVKETAVTEARDPAEDLENILSQIQGVGKVQVLLTEATGAETVYQTDQDRSAAEGSESVRIETVIITDENRAQAGLVKTITPPTYLGAIVVCQGGDNAVVRLSIVEAVSTVTGISADRITVLKMK